MFERGGGELLPNSNLVDKVNSSAMIRFHQAKGKSKYLVEMKTYLISFISKIFTKWLKESVELRTFLK